MECVLVSLNIQQKRMKGTVSYDAKTLLKETQAYMHVQRIHTNIEAR